jgi:RNA polymerase sigma-70 factor (ECF subfamily)
MKEPSSDPHLAFTRQFVTALPALHGFVFSLVHDTHATDDLMQDLAERMWLKFADYDESRPFVAWGIGFARLLVMEWRRKQRRAPLPLDEATLELLAEEAAEQCQGYYERIDALRKCLGQLNDRQRAVLHLRYQEERPVKSIAQQWNRTQMAVYKMLKHVHLTLLDCISQSHPRTAP